MLATQQSFLVLRKQPQPPAGSRLHPCPTPPTVKIANRPCVQNPPQVQFGLPSESDHQWTRGSAGCCTTRHCSVHTGDPLMRRKLVTVAQSNGTYNPPKVLDKRALVRKFKRFRTTFTKKDKIKTLATCEPNMCVLN
ncbi:hypothetical protein BaRGS_00008098 [Batillaria attramentaria]|uniref:Uncharacterized protein n=1 Tax=Batillaria attramentaria TaxID=370345 RepID=A0ABD0LNG0_9CAEN